MSKKCTLTDAELHDAVQKWVSKLCDTGGRAWTLSVPVNFDRDPDMIITELCNRHAALIARHNALREAIHKAMERTVDCDKKQTDDQLIADVAYLKRLASDYFKTSVDCGNRAFVVDQKYDALVEAVAWEREFDEVLVWLVRTGRYPRDMASRYDLANERECARAEVGRLIGEGQ